MGNPSEPATANTGVNINTPNQAQQEPIIDQIENKVVTQAQAGLSVLEQDLIEFVQKSAPKIKNAIGLLGGELADELKGALDHARAIAEKHNIGLGGL